MSRACSSGELRVCQDKPLAGCGWTVEEMDQVPELLKNFIAEENKETLEVDMSVWVAVATK